MIVEGARFLSTGSGCAGVFLASAMPRVSGPPLSSSGSPGAIRNFPKFQFLPGNLWVSFALTGSAMSPIFLEGSSCVCVGTGNSTPAMFVVGGSAPETGSRPASVSPSSRGPDSGSPRFPSAHRTPRDPGCHPTPSPTPGNEPTPGFSQHAALRELCQHRKRLFRHLC